jgi:predicted LPLAT superfamily acyltransferase
MNDPIAEQSEPRAETSQADWAEQNIGPAWHERFFGWVLRTFGMTRAYHLSYFGTLWYVTFHPAIRRRCRFYLDRRFPERTGRIRRFLDSYHLLRNFAKSLVDMAAVNAIGKHALEDASPDREAVNKLAAGERGFIMLHAHVGSWQIGMSTTASFAKPLWLVLIPERRTVQMIEAEKVGLIDPRGGVDGVMLMTEALLRGEIVAVMGDRAFGDPRNRVQVNFLGSPIKLPVTPYRVASATGTPVAVLLSAKNADRSYEMRLAKLIEVPPGLGRAVQSYAPYAQQFADCLEEYVEQYPWQFFNFFDLWAQ